MYCSRNDWIPALFPSIFKAGFVQLDLLYAFVPKD